MGLSPPVRSVPFNLDLVFQKGMGRRLLLSMLAFAIPPMVLFGWINYRTAARQMDHEIRQTIQVNAQLKSQQVIAYLQGRIVDAERQGSAPATIAFFNALVRRHMATEETLSDFVLSPPWNRAVSAYGSGIQLHADLHGYPDILMIDIDGNVLFSNAKTGDLAGNLNQNALAGTKISAAFGETLKTGKTVFSGFETGVPEDPGGRAFITAAIGSVGAPPQGVIAFKIPGSDIQALLNMPPEPDQTVRIYLIDTELTLLAGTIEGQRPDTLLTIKTAIAQQWHQAVTSDKSTLPPPGLLHYRDPGGHWIVGTYASIQPGPSPYALVVEIDRTMAFAAIYRQQTIFLAIVILTGLGIIAVSVVLARGLVEPLTALTGQVSLATQGQLGSGMDVPASHELGRLAVACNRLVDRMQSLTIEHETQSRLLAGIASLHRSIGGVLEPGELCLKTIEFLSDFLDISQADFYLVNEAKRLQCICHFPGQPAHTPDLLFYPGEGRMVEAAVEMTLLAFRKDAPDGPVIPVPTVDLGNVATLPLMLQETVIGGLEVEKTTVFSLFDGLFLQSVAEFIAVALEAALAREKERVLLERTRDQAQKLTHREAALKTKTHELEKQTQALQQSEQVLQLKHLELEAANAQMAKNAADLEANMAILEQQKREMQKQNTALESAHRELADKAQQLEISSQYKTEFMANMSHELRTPLNSILLLSRLLMENRQGTLSSKQSEYSQTIHSAGEDLLNLINEILDLAKVESGKVAIETGPVEIQSIAQHMQGSFNPLAEQSGIAFQTDVAPMVPKQFISDRKRIEQIVKNFLSNAFKFTPSGSIRLTFTVSNQPPTDQPTLDPNTRWLTISVIDTGIGIPAAKQQMVFEAFQQVDGSTRRKYGGTGLGLSISRQLARMLGGEITLDSEEAKGSRFSLHLPLSSTATNEPGAIGNQVVQATPPSTPPSSSSDENVASHQGGELIPDDRHRVAPGGRCILIIEADGEVIEPIMTVAYDHGLKVLVAEQQMTGLHFADYYLPMAVFFNPHLSAPGAWSIIDKLRGNPKNHHLPVFTLSGQTEHSQAMVYGAAGHILLPPAKSRLELAFRQIEMWHAQDDRTVLVLAASPQQAVDQIRTVTGMRSIDCIPVSTATDARLALDAHTVDAAVIYACVDDAQQEQFLTVWQERPIPLINYAKTTVRSGNPAPGKAFANLTDLNPITSPNQLLMALLASLHLSPDKLDPPQRKRVEAMHRHASPLKSVNVLLVDDDMRTVFAVSSVLEDQGVNVYTGKTGKESLDKLDSFPDIDLILMDVMIADVDGYQAIRNIRDRQGYENIPILALTAKAMQGDRAKCIEAGADDYLSKPVNLDKLTSMLRIWLDPGLTQWR